MAKIQLTENIPTADDRTFPYLGVVQLVANFPVNPSTDRIASLKFCVQPYRIVQDGDAEIRVPHPDIEKCVTLPNVTLDMLPAGSIVEVAKVLIVTNIPEWASAEVVDDV
jgi:hypothetical protein